MGKKKILLNSICIVGMAVIFSYACKLEYRMGWIRDEYGISGKDELLPFNSQLIILLLPLAVILINIFSILYKKMKKSILTVIIILSVGAMIISAAATVRVSLKMNEFPIEKIGMTEEKR